MLVISEIENIEQAIQDTPLAALLVVEHAIERRQRPACWAAEAMLRRE